MDIPTATTDNVTELLAKILDFVERRRTILTDNIVSAHRKGFVPKDLDVDQFAELMTEAVSEHVLSRRLILRDGSNIRFGANGSFQSSPVADEEAMRLYETDMKKYVELQVKKLSDNTVNKKVAIELLRQKRGSSAPMSS